MVGLDFEERGDESVEILPRDLILLGGRDDGVHKLEGRDLLVECAMGREARARRPSLAQRRLLPATVVTREGKG